MNVNKVLNYIESLLHEEAQKGCATDLSDLQERYKVRQTLRCNLVSIIEYISNLEDQVEHLPLLPSLQDAQWAQASLALDNLAFLSVDTSGLGSDGSILRVLLLNQHEDILFDTFIQPHEKISKQVHHLTGITEHNIENASSFVEVWPSVRNALSGKYLLSYNLEFNRNVLRANAEHLNFSFPFLIAECLMQKSMNYFHESYPSKLVDICRRINAALPDHPYQTAYHRARGQLRLLQAMSQGVMCVSDIFSTAYEDENILF